MGKKFNIVTATCGEKYMLPGRGMFEFRYVAEPPPGLIFVLFDRGGDTYLFEGQYENAFLVEGE